MPTTPITVTQPVAGAWKFKFTPVAGAADYLAEIIYQPSPPNPARQFWKSLIAAPSTSADIDIEIPPGVGAIEYDGCSFRLTAVDAAGAPIGEGVVANIRLETAHQPPLVVNPPPVPPLAPSATSWRKRHQRKLILLLIIIMMMIVGVLVGAVILLLNGKHDRSALEQQDYAARRQAYDVGLHQEELAKQQELLARHRSPAPSIASPVAVPSPASSGTSATAPAPQDLSVLGIPWPSRYSKVVKTIIVPDPSWGNVTSYETNVFLELGQTVQFTKDPDWNVYMDPDGTMLHAVDGSDRKTGPSCPGREYRVTPAIGRIHLRLVCTKP